MKIVLNLSFSIPTTLNIGKAYIAPPPPHDYGCMCRYPFAVVGIDLTGEVYSWLKNGSLDLYFYSNSTQWPLSLEHFMEVFSMLL